MKEDLKDIFHNVNEWLKFAEAKHAGLIVLNSGLVFGILSVYASFASKMHWSFILLALICLGLSILITLISLYPKTLKEIPHSIIKDPNLYFNGDVARLTPNSFKAELLKTHPGHEFTELENDLIDQTIINSKVASRKYLLFRYAIIFTTVGISLPLLRILIKIAFGV